MSTRIITRFPKNDRRHEQLGDALIGLSAAIFFIGMFVLLLMIPASRSGYDITGGPEAPQDFVGP